MFFLGAGKHETGTSKSRIMTLNICLYNQNGKLSTYPNSVPDEGYSFMEKRNLRPAKHEFSKTDLV